MLLVLAKIVFWIIVCVVCVVILAFVGETLLKSFEAEDKGREE